jgi:Ni,Fe-hydrogenase III large subunit
MDRLVSEAGPAHALLAMAASLERLASHRARMGSVAPVVGLKSAAQDLLALVERV